MIEHIFRNINDIRIFDLICEYLYYEEEIKELTDDKGTLDIDDIMDLLEYGEYKRIEVEDSVEHFVRNKILGLKKIKMKGHTGCKICSWTDKLKLPRIGEHKTHSEYKEQTRFANNYYMIRNDITEMLIGASFSHVFLTCEQESSTKEEEKEEEKPEIKE